MKTLLLVLALTLPLWGESATLQAVSARTLPGRIHSGAHVYRFASLLLEVYPQGKQAVLDVHRLDGTRLTREVVPVAWLGGSLEVGALDEKAPGQGWGLWSSDVSVELLFFRGDGSHGHWKREYPSEFSTTGWSTVDRKSVV